jgi:hypothetical protein
MDQEHINQPISDLTDIKNTIGSIKDLPVESHSLEFEKIHQQLKQALTNLDGV